MDDRVKRFILDLLKQHNLLTLATAREDGYPQATTVTYANEDLTLYFAAAKDSQKIHNISRNNKVSLTIDKDYEDWSKIKGLSMAGSAEVLTEPAAAKRALGCLMKKFPQWSRLPIPIDPAEIAVVKITPKVISVIDYERGFGHADLVEV